ncbi:hypothetical protein CEXT_627001 [Caerostris extrusa]|uniref:Uncharacterized protein n=1 Tax=Caerostris extrusa TaxID=172846 RepID=A0AAV4XNY4_CAEEX|nr:hypothetical protein CEXT_627001 [Caerostris extrusa]
MHRVWGIGIRAQSPALSVTRENHEKKISECLPPPFLWYRRARCGRPCLCGKKGTIFELSSVAMPFLVLVPVTPHPVEDGRPFHTKQTPCPLMVIQARNRVQSANKTQKTQCWWKMENFATMMDSSRCRRKEVVVMRASDELLWVSRVG